MLIFLLVFTGHYAEDSWRIGDIVYTDIDVLRNDLTSRGYVRNRRETELFPERWYNEIRSLIPGDTNVFAEIITRKVNL